MLDEKQLRLTLRTTASRLGLTCLMVISFAAVDGRLCAAGAGDTIDFDRAIRPIFSESCYPCHGPDEHKRKANLRFDRKDVAFKALKDGTFAIVPGHPAQSQLVQRITASDPDQKMPPPNSGHTLTPSQ